jgi:4,5-dihydroxyphthalate decarboxylase
MAVADLSLVNVLRASLPWIAAEAEAQTRIMGGDPWPYGFRRNRDEVVAMIRYARADALALRDIVPEDLFHSSVLNE